MATNTLNIRSMTRNEVAETLEWAAGEGWNPGLYDAEAFFHTDRNGFFIATHNDETAGVIAAVAYDETFGCIGLHIVKPDYAAQNVGETLLKHALDYLGDRTIGVTANLEQEPFYTGAGFQTAHRITRYEGEGGGSLPRLRQYDVVPLDQIPLPVLEAYDLRMFPVARPAFLRWWLRQEEATTVGMLRNDRMAGYGVLRRGHHGRKLGPVFADTPQIAKDLIKALLSSIPGEPVMIDAPDNNPATSDLMRVLKFKPAFETLRMYAGEPPQLPANQIFGVTTLHLG